MVTSSCGFLIHCGAILIAVLQFGGPAVKLQAPHEMLYSGDAEQAKELTELRDWQLRSGKELKGKLLNWGTGNGIVVFRDQFSRAAYFPLRQFSEPLQLEIASLLEVGQKEIKPLRDKLPVFEVELKPTSGEIPVGSLPIDLRDGFVYWINNGRYFRSPQSLFEAAPLAKLASTLKNRERFEIWDIPSTIGPLHAQLIGTTDDGLVMRGMSYAGMMIDDIEYQVPISFFAEADQERAKKLLASMPGGGSVAIDKAPSGWVGLEWNITPPKRPIAIEGAVLKFSQPIVQPTLPGSSGTVQEFKLIEAQIPLQMLTSNGEFFVRSVLEKERLLKENPRLAKNELDNRLGEFRATLVDSNPIHFLSPINTWIFRDSPPNMPLQARVVAEAGDYFVFKLEQVDTTFWLLKSEVPARFQSYCSTTAARLAEYFKAHPSSRPKLESKMRLVRTFENIAMQQVAEPVEAGLDRDKMALITPPWNGQPVKLSLALNSMHYVDLRELKRVIEGKVPTLDSKPMSEIDRIASEIAEQLQGMESRSDIWGIAAPGDDMRQSMIGFRGAVIRRFQDSVVFRADKNEFLVDLEILPKTDRGRAEKSLALLEELRAQSRVTSTSSEEPPAARLWGALSGPLIGSKPQFNADGSVTYTNMFGAQETATSNNLNMVLTAEIRTQVEADAQIRSKKTKLDASELQQLSNLKQSLRKQYMDLANAAAPKHFGLKDSAIAATGRFEMFDGEDAILRDPQGKLMRVFRFALKDESIAEMTKFEQDLKAQGKASTTPDLKPSEVTARHFRGSKFSAFLPGTPIRFDGRNLYVQYASGGFGRYAVDSIHKDDLTAIRSNLYLATNGLKRDTGINERLKGPVKPEDVIIATAELADKWKQRLDQLAQPRATVWSKKKIDIKGRDEVVAVSPDGSRIVVAGSQLQVISLADSTAVTIDSKAKTLSPAFIANDNQYLVGVDDEKLKRWDLKTGELVEQFDAVNQAPIAWCQTADGQRIIMLADAKQLYVLDLKANELQRMRFGNDSQFAALPGLWCSANGDRFIARSGKSLQVFVWDKENTTYKPDYPIECLYESVQVAFGQEIILIADTHSANLSAVGRANGRFSIAEIGTGLHPEFLSVEEVDGEEVVHIIGKRSDPLSQAAPYCFSAYLGLDRRIARAAQSIDIPNDSKALIAASGRTAIVKSGEGWEVATAGPLSETLFKALDGIARDLIDETDVGQIDAAWEYLRGAVFQRLGEYPDHASELFLEYMGLHVANYKWQHGGDMNERADLLLDRWRKMAPKSMFVPTLAAIHQRRMAWDARGSGFADTVTEEGAKVFKERMLAVAALLKPIFQLEHPPTRAYSIAYDVAMSLSLPAEVTKNLNASMMKTPVRSSTPSHAAVVLSLLPRWHGSPGDSERYITAIANKLGGEEGDSMYASLMLFAANYYPADEPASNYLEYDVERVLRGLRVFYRLPHSAENFQRALRVFAGEERWDLYKQAMELRTEERIFQDDTTIKTLEMHLAQEKMALEKPRSAGVPAR